MTTEAENEVGAKKSRKGSSIAQETARVKNIDSIKVHRRGSTFTIDIKIAVDRHLTVKEGYRIASEVKFELLKRVQHTRDVMVHINPHQPENDR